MFQTDEILSLIQASFVQLRFILGLVPREGYWEHFELYMSSLNGAFSQFLQEDYHLLTLATKAFKASLEEIVPLTFAVGESCLTAISLQFPGVKTSTAAVWYKAHDQVYIVENLGVMLQHADSLADPKKGMYFSCTTWGSVSYVSTTLAAEKMGLVESTGRWGAFADDFKAERILIDVLWTCGIRSINRKGSAVVDYHSCLATEGQTPFTCLDKLILTCPSDNANGVYRCSLPGCPKTTMGNKMPFECRHFVGALMTFNDHNNKQDCDSMCLRLKACCGCHHERSGL